MPSSNLAIPLASQKKFTVISATNLRMVAMSFWLAHRTQLHVFPNEFCENRTGDYKVINRKLNRQTHTPVLPSDMATTRFSLTAGH
jgi:hypothetical protein